MNRSGLARLMRSSFENEIMALEHFSRVADQLSFDHFTRRRFEILIRQVFDDEIMALREAGQKEYAHDVDNAFANFERAGEDLNLDPMHVVWIFAMKHRDGIVAYLRGHKSQREDVRGRINDLIVYLFILRGMIDEQSLKQETAHGPSPAGREGHVTGPSVGVSDSVDPG